MIPCAKDWRRSIQIVGLQLAPFVVLVSIWLPLLRRFYIATPTISDSVIQQSRQLPADSVLEELRPFTFMEPPFQDTQLIASAEELMHGRIQMPGLPPVRFSFPFDEADFEKVPPSLQLSWAGLVVPQVLVAAYNKTGEDKFLLAARDVLLGWASYERNNWLPRGYVWNDHAVAARIPVLTEFWRLYRHHHSYDSQTARVIIQFAARSGLMLAKPGQFTFSTNHGIMQNLGLLHLCVAFPALPNTNEQEKRALSRFSDQINFYIGGEGIVLEHSAGYHAFGLRLLGMGLRYLTLLGEPVPERWTEKYERAKLFYAQLRRPDGSLPMVGDTDGALDRLGPLTTSVSDQRAQPLRYWQDWTPNAPFSLYPVAGYAVWWDRQSSELGSNPSHLSQSVASWSYLPGLGHKHADEMTFLLWAAGHNWVTNAGYWPYWMRGRDWAVSWAGSNAPHITDEPSNSQRNTKLVFSGWSGQVAALSMERDGPGKYVAVRQIVHVKPNLWLIVDGINGDSGSRTTTAWTAGPELGLSRGLYPAAFRLQADNGAVMSTFFTGSEGMTVRVLQGSVNPFGGWEVVNQVPQPAPAVVTEEPVNGWAATLLVLGDEKPPLNSMPHMISWTGNHHWKFEISLRSSTVHISWDGDRLAVVEGLIGHRPPVTLKLTQVPDVSGDRSQLLAAYAAADRKYPIFHDYLPYRTRLTVVLIMLWALVEIGLAVYRRRHKLHYGAIRVTVAIAWLLLGLWANVFYFRA